MAPGTDEFDAILKFDARKLAAMAMPALWTITAGAPRAVHAALLTPPFSISLLARVHRRHGKVQMRCFAGAASSRDQCRCAASHRRPRKSVCIHP